MKEILFTNDEADYIIRILDKFANNEKLIKKIKNAQKKIKVSSAKGKGRNLQYWVCQKISELLNIPYNQQDDNCLIHSREMGLNGVDIILRGKAYDSFPFDIECKACETLSIPEWVRQARANNKKSNRFWMLIFKKQTIGGEPLVIIDWNTFEILYKLLIKNYCSYNNSMEEKENG